MLTDSAQAQDRVVGKLQALVRIPTVSDRDPALVDTDAFDRLLAELADAVPAPARRARADPGRHATACCSAGRARARERRSC